MRYPISPPYIPFKGLHRAHSLLTNSKRILIKAGAADDLKLSQKRTSEAVDDAQGLLPCGFKPGTDKLPSFAQAKPESEIGQIRVEEVDGCYKLHFQGGDSMTATAISPVHLCPSHTHFYFEVSVESLDLLMAVGYARDGETPQQTLPGWSPGTYGLHSDDGLLQANLYPPWDSFFFLFEFFVCIQPKRDIVHFFNSGSKGSIGTPQRRGSCRAGR